MKDLEYIDYCINSLLDNNNTILYIFDNRIRFDFTKDFYDNTLGLSFVFSRNDTTNQKFLLPGEYLYLNFNFTKEFSYRFLNHSFEPVDVLYDHLLWDKKNWGGQHLEIKTVIFHSEKNSKDIQEINRRGFKDIHWFAHGYLCAEHWYRLYNLDITKNYHARPIQSNFVCANRLIDNNRNYRIKLLNQLNLENSVYSLLPHDPQTGKSVNDIFPNNRVQPHSFDEHENSSAWITVQKLTPINTAFLHVVTETIFYENKQHLTEKIFKPIVLGQPFVLATGYKGLKYLKSYGFKTFDQWWDESYDDIEDPQDRIQAIAKVVNNIAKLPLSQLEDLRKEMSDVLDHNYQRFYGTFADDCWQELSDGIKQTYSCL